MMNEALLPNGINAVFASQPQAFETKGIGSENLRGSQIGGRCLYARVRAPAHI
jgi:hypothetical protein